MWDCVGVRDVRPPRLHVFVCVNARDASDPLGPGCGARGDSVYARLKDEVARRGEVADTWITRTLCLGVCPKEGCTVSAGGRIVRDVLPDDAPTLLVVTDALEAVEDLQRKKVLDLARRINPKLTMEDVQNPHDFPELDDTDWHYEDGLLTGIQTARAALRSRR